MKWFFRIFFRTLRVVLTPVMLFWEQVAAPPGTTRQPEDQRRVDQETGKLQLYQFQACPFCIKVRREMRRLSLNIELRDAQKDATARAELLQGGGEVKVPCLKITDEQGNSRWMYESADIIRYLQERFA